MALKRGKMSAATRKEVRDLASNAVPLSLSIDVTVSTPDFGNACKDAKTKLAAARKNWEDAGRPKRGRLYTEMIAAAVTAEVMCALAGS